MINHVKRAHSAAEHSKPSENILEQSSFNGAIEGGSNNYPPKETQDETYEPPISNNRDENIQINVHNETKKPCPYRL